MAVYDVCQVYKTRLPIKVCETALGDDFRKLRFMKIGFARVSTVTRTWNSNSMP